MKARSKKQPDIALGENGLPLWREHDVEFVRRKLAETHPTPIDNIAALVRSLGFEDRSGTNNGPSDPYYRIRAALHEGRRRGIFKKSSHQWGIADGMEAKAS